MPTHSHTFNQDQKRPGEGKTLLVIALTGGMMVLEILFGLWTGSMALLADGLHMASHALALGITAFAYMYARHHANDRRYTFGTGKVNALGGFTGAVLLGVFALVMAGESVHRMWRPVAITLDQAIIVAVLGLIVNGVSAKVLAHAGDVHEHPHHYGSEDHNLRSAYLHVIADALTSLLAIVALLSAKYWGLTWMDPLMGIVGAVLVARWSVGLLKSAGGVLLDRQVLPLESEIRQSLAKSGAMVVDLHVWAIGGNNFCAIVSVVSANPQPPRYYRKLLLEHEELVHVTVEVNAPHGLKSEV